MTPPRISALTRGAALGLALAPAWHAPVSAQGPSGPEAGAAAVEADAIVGVWTTEPEDGEWGRVEIRPCGGLYCGRIVWLSEPTVDEAGAWGEVGDPKTDWHNPDEALRDRPIIGLEILESFRFEDGRWKDGRIYDPKNGKTYRCELTLAEDGRVLKVRGYVRLLFVNVGRTTEWTRFQSSPSSVERTRRSSSAGVNGLLIRSPVSGRDRILEARASE